MQEDGLVPIGELARRTGVATSALRYYERVGLLSPAGRAGRRRHYRPSSAERVALIRLCQDAGFTLAEIGRLLAAWGRGGRTGVAWPNERPRSSTPASRTPGGRRSSSTTRSTAPTAISSPAPTSAPRSRPGSSVPVASTSRHRPPRRPTNERTPPCRQPTLFTRLPRRVIPRTSPLGGSRKFVGGRKANQKETKRTKPAKVCSGTLRALTRQRPTRCLA